MVEFGLRSWIHNGNNNIRYYSKFVLMLHMSVIKKMVTKKTFTDDKCLMPKLCDLVDVECTNKTPLNITGAEQENVIQIRHNKDRQQMM